MLHIDCPYCGLRDEIEFSCGGEANITRPVNSSILSHKEWSEYLFFRYNPKGYFIERWVHSSGCRRWFNLVRNTLNNEIYEVYKIGSNPKTKEGKIAYKNNWRRLSKAEQINLEIINVKK
tara:strand:- start:225 stop:584 length:360 start_codon:yes stop_codon:yes gene_type:complete